MPLHFHAASFQPTPPASRDYAPAPCYVLPSPPRKGFQRVADPLAGHGAAPRMLMRNTLSANAPAGRDYALRPLWLPSPSPERVSKGSRTLWRGTGQRPVYLCATRCQRMPRQTPAADTNLAGRRIGNTLSDCRTLHEYCGTRSANTLPAQSGHQSRCHAAAQHHWHWALSPHPAATHNGACPPVPDS